MESIAYMSDQSLFIKNVARSLRKNGYLIVTTPNWPLWESQGKPRASPTSLSAHHFSMRELSTMIGQSLKVIIKKTMLPTGNSGICRITNSVKLNKLLELVVSRDFLDRVKGRVGLGQSLFVVAQKQ
jgi:hypothetical protein